MIERKYIASGSTGRCIGGIRQQFSTPAAIRLMKENVKLFSEMEEEFGFTVEFHQGGYLLLAHSPEMKEIFKSNIKLQQKEGVNVSLLTPKEAKEVVPDLDIEAIFDGAVVFSDWFRGYGNMVILDHGSGYYTLYAHAEELLVREGQVVDGGDILGRVGETDSVKGPALHFEIRQGAEALNPAAWLQRR